MDEERKIKLPAYLIINSEGLIKQIAEVKKEQAHLSMALDKLNALLGEFELEEMGKISKIPPRPKVG